MDPSFFQFSPPHSEHWRLSLMQPWRCQASTLSLSPSLVLPVSKGRQMNSEWTSQSQDHSLFPLGYFVSYAISFLYFSFPPFFLIFSSQDKHLLRHFEIPKANFETVSCKPKSCPWVPIVFFSQMATAGNPVELFEFKELRPSAYWGHHCHWKMTMV